MYVVTFYSYKGGVGRSMALLNTAMTLAADGKRVLVVDFDLEAPGLTTFEALRCARGHPGVVDFVSEYSRTAVAPDVTDYIVPCDMGDAFLWVMSAGDNSSPDYTGRLASIDWDYIYDEQEGFLMLEDLRTQWAKYDSKGFDYVLLDSRTGHTDEGGICTRQLPDAVVVMFLPNEQNIEGLAPIVEGIREESRSREGGVALHFCPSNVPDEFDEHNVLGEMLDLAAERLGYADRVSIDQPAAVIQHWSSLELLKQPAMARVRPNSRLAKQYAELRNAIEASNLADEDGALKALARTQSELQVLRGAGRSTDLPRLTRHVQEIRRLHPRSGRVAFAGAQLFNLLKEPGLEVAALSDAISFGFRRDEARLARSLALHGSRQQPESIEDLRAVLGSPDATRFEIVPAFRVLTLIDPDWYGTTEQLYHKPDIRFRSRIVLAEGLMTRREMLPQVTRDLDAIASDASLSDEQRHDARQHALLARIGALDLESVLAEYDRDAILSGSDAAAAFNLAIAEWGAQGKPPRDLLARVVEVIGDDDVDANGHQCLALVYSVLGDRAAASAQLDLARAEVGIGGLVFSCWRFLYATTDEMQADLAEMAQLVDSQAELTPPFLRPPYDGRT